MAGSNGKATSQAERHARRERVGRDEGVHLRLLGSALQSRHGGEQLV